MRGINLVGQRFGKLVVLEEAERANCGKRQWKCRCDCGNVVTVIGGNLTKGNSTSCGCSKVADITGKRFGSLVALHPTAQRDYNGNIVWECLCDCGETATVGVTELTTGHVRSCGCSLRLHLEGQRFGRLQVVSFSHIANGRSMWNCLCDCGTECIISSHELQSGDTTSCGCYNRELNSARMTTHGYSKTRLYKIWKQMLQRCENQNDSSYADYGKAGISVCDDWHTFETFRVWAMSMGYKDDLSIDRISPFRDYTPENCRWATDKQQGSNKRRAYYNLVRYAYNEGIERYVDVDNRVYVQEFMSIICDAYYWSTLFRKTGYTFQDEDSSRVLHDFVLSYVWSYQSFLNWAFSYYLGKCNDAFDSAVFDLSWSELPCFDYQKFLEDFYYCVRVEEGT